MPEVRFRPFSWSDVPAITAIYRPYVDDTVITFETEPPSEAAMAERFGKLLDLKHPLIIASIVNIFLASSMLDFAISAIGVLIFVGLTAYDTQKIKESYSSGFGADVLAKGAVMGALSLYLDFINLFMMLLRLFGNRE